MQCGCEGALAHEEKLKRDEERRAEQELQNRFLRAGVKKRFLGASHRPPGACEIHQLIQRRPLDRPLHHRAFACREEPFGLRARKGLRGGGLYDRPHDVHSDARQREGELDGDAKAGVSRFASCDVLIIDDLGKENANSWVMTTLFQIVNDRYEAMRPTIVTTQYSPEELCRRMSRSGERESAIAITERLKETCHLMTLPKRANVNLMKDGRSEP